MKSKTIFILFAISFVIAITGNIFLYQKRMASPSLPQLGQINNFVLQDSEGKTVTLNDLKGKVWVGNFFFTTCSDICPMMTKNMAALHRSFALLNDVTMVSISVNPEIDSSAILKTYAKKFNADTTKWLFLTGSRDEIQKLAVQSFKLGAIDEPIFHSSYFALIDRNANIRGYYDGTKKEGVDQLFKDIARLVKDK